MISPDSIHRITYVGPINDDFVRFIMNKVNSFTSDPVLLELLLNSDGGSVRSGITAYNYLKTLPCVIHTRNIGHVDSAAILPFLAGKVRTAEMMSMFTFHPATIPANGPLNYAQLDEKSIILNTDINAYAAIVTKEAPVFASEHDIIHLLRYETIILTETEECQRVGILTPPGKPITIMPGNIIHQEG